MRSVSVMVLSVGLLVGGWGTDVARLVTWAVPGSRCDLRQWQPEARSDPVCWRVYAANLSRTAAVKTECGCARLPGQALATGGAHGFPYSAQEEKGGMDEAGENKALLIECVLHTFLERKCKEDN